MSELFVHRILRLENYRFVRQRLVSRFELESYRCPARGDLIQRAAADLLGRKSTESVSYPATWWEHFKHRFAPAWFLKRWPVRLTTWEVDAYALFPELGPVRQRYLELAFCEELRCAREP